MKALDKIYLQVCGDCNDDDCNNCKFEDVEDVTWCKDRIFPKDIEYIRKDVFIEKACKYLFENYHGEKLSLRMIEDFKQFMKGEHISQEEKELQKEKESSLEKTDDEDISVITWIYLE